MTAPDFINDTICPWYYHQTTGMTDVNTIISDLRTGLVTNLSWTEPTTALFKSPVDSAGRFMDILVTRITATNVEFRIRDFRGSTLVTGRIQIDATASVNYFLTKFSMTVESLRATIEIAHAHILEQTPDEASSLSNYITGNTYRNASDTADGSWGLGRLIAFESGSPALVSGRFSNSQNALLTNIASFSAAGTLLYRDCCMPITQNGVLRWSGRLYQAWLCDSGLAFGTDKTIPVDDAGATAVFRVVGFPTFNTYRLALRKA